jgi:hypothetical protein
MATAFERARSKRKTAPVRGQRLTVAKSAMQNQERGHTN